MSGQLGQVFNIQHFSTHDGPGVRTTVFLKGCPLRCFWCQNPESQSIQPVMLRTNRLCTGCGACIGACPYEANAITDGKSHTDRSLCQACGKCVRVCRNKARSISGKEMTVEAVMREVLQDRQFYMNSGGGMTVSGGDPVYQIDFAMALLQAAKEKNIHTAVETSAFTSWERLSALLEYTDFFIMDLKCIDPQKHLEGTGVPNDVILENAKRASQKHGQILFRTPLIPGFNDSPEDIIQLRNFVEKEVGINPKEHIELLKYNRLGEDKYDYMDKEGTHPTFDPQEETYMQELNALLD